MAATVEVSQIAPKLEQQDDVASAPIESAWKKPLTPKMKSSEIDIDPDSKEAQREEGKPLKDSENEQSKEKTENSKIDGEKGLGKEAVKPKIFDKKNFVEAPLPKTNPWGKKGSVPGELQG